MPVRYAVIDGCPCPKPLYPILRKLKKETGCTFNSIYRGDDVAGILHKHGKRTQRELFEQLPPGVANPPDRGTHVLRGDGTVGRLFDVLPWWRCGIDIDDDEVDAVIAAADRHGWDLYRPYASASERHHINFRKKPSRWRAFFRNVFPKKRKKRPRKPKPVGISGGVPAPAPHRPPPRPAKPPRGRDVLGPAIDVSDAQGSVDWEKVATKVPVAFTKATEGRTFTAATFTGKRLKAMKKAGLRTGVYHFARPDNNPARAEVEHFVSTVRDAGGEFISYEAWREGKPGIVAVLDFEHEPFDEGWAATWGAWFEKETGVKALLYGYGSSLNPVLGALRHFAGIWFAAYVDDWRPFLAGKHHRVVFWQDTDNWNCPGVSGGVDHNRYLGKEKP
jgi:GH25 family lysozyme M1 (1,4-beta-N-acetylmuramidase)